MLQLESGASPGSAARYEETFSTGSVFWTSDPITVDPESDAATLFGQCWIWRHQLRDAPGWHVDLVLEGLDSGRSYTFAGTAMRGAGDMLDMPPIGSGADAFTYASSRGAWKVGEDGVEFGTGHNEVGYVARWTGIRPEPMGNYHSTTHTVGEAGEAPGAHAYKAMRVAPSCWSWNRAAARPPSKTCRSCSFSPSRLARQSSFQDRRCSDPGDGVLSTDRVEMWLDGSKVEASLLESDGLIEIMHARIRPLKVDRFMGLMRFIDTLTPELPKCLVFYCGLQ